MSKPGSACRLEDGMPQPRRSLKIEIPSKSSWFEEWHNFAQREMRLSC